MLRGSNVCCRSSAATTVITAPVSVVTIAALESFCAQTSEGCRVRAVGSFVAGSSINERTKPRVERRRLRTRCQGLAALSVRAQIAMIAA